MRRKLTDGGPAFPVAPRQPYPKCGDRQFYGGPCPVCRGGGRETHPGMTLRDWFAGQALIGIVSAGPGAYPLDANGWAALATASYALADAMLAERNK